MKTGQLFADVEQDTLGFAHPLIGALVAKKWNFPLETCQVILHHHDPMEDTLTDPKPREDRDYRRGRPHRTQAWLRPSGRLPGPERGASQSDEAARHS